MENSAEVSILLDELAEVLGDPIVAIVVLVGGEQLAVIPHPGEVAREVLATLSGVNWKLAIRMAEEHCV